MEPGGSAPGKSEWSELTAFSSPPTAPPVSPPLCLPQGLPRSGPGDHPLLPASPKQAQLPGGANATWLPPEAAPETKLLPSPKHFLASSSLGRSQGTTLASDPPCSLTQEPPSHAGKQSPSLPVSPPRQPGRRHLHGASHSFPRKQEAGFQGGASEDKVDHPPATQATRSPPAPHRLRGPEGKVGLRQARRGALPP